MSENLRTIKYRDGNPISLVTDETAWKSLQTGGYCWYDNDENSYKNKYGALYNWYSFENNMLCPTGWHVPTWDEVNELYNYLDETSNYVVTYQLKAESGWNDDNGNNLSGYTALPNGQREPTGSFIGIEETASWWSSSEYTTDLGFYHYIVKDGAGRTFSSKNRGASIRCIKD